MKFGQSKPRSIDGNMVVALDGPSGVGKSTIARQLASRLGLPYLDTGAMYRALGFKVLEEGLDPADQAAVEKLAQRIEMVVVPTDTGQLEILVDGLAVNDSIRTTEVGQATSKIAAYPKVRVAMVHRQRAAALPRGAVVEGRDIGTAVFPEAAFKFYLEAPVDVRSERRYAQLLQSGNQTITLEQVDREVRERDDRDSSRAASPLKRDSSYQVISTAQATPEQIVDQIALLIEGTADA